jgi:Na+/glutamate symporter
MTINLEPLASLFAALVVLLIGTLVNRRVSFLSK